MRRQISVNLLSLGHHGGHRGGGGGGSLVVSDFKERSWSGDDLVGAEG